MTRGPGAEFQVFSAEAAAPGCGGTSAAACRAAGTPRARRRVAGARRPAHRRRAPLPGEPLPMRQAASSQARPTSRCRTARPCGSSPARGSGTTRRPRCSSSRRSSCATRRRSSAGGSPPCRTRPRGWPLRPCTPDPCPPALVDVLPCHDDRALDLRVPVLVPEGAVRLRLRRVVRRRTACEDLVLRVDLELVVVLVVPAPGRSSARRCPSSRAWAARVDVHMSFWSACPSTS